MSKIVYFLISISIIGSTTACTRFFLPANYMHDEVYTSKPFLSPADSAHTYRQGLYATGRLATSTMLSLNDQGKTQTTAGMLQIHHAHSFRLFNLAYGMQGSLGSVKIPAPDAQKMQYPIQAQGNKNFTTLGGRIEGNVKAPFTGKFFEWRMVGFSLNYSKEFGQYRRFLQNLVPSEGLSYANSDKIFTWGINTEFCWQFGKKTPANAQNGIAFRIGYLKSRFDNFIDGLNTTKGTYQRENISFALVMKAKNLQFMYQTVSDSEVPIPIFAGVFHSFGVNFNLLSLGKGN